MERPYDPAPGVRGFLAGTPTILALGAVEEGARLAAEAGVERLRAKASQLTELLVTVHDERLAELGFRLGSPRDPARRGAHVSLAHDEAWPICRALIERARAVGDFLILRAVRESGGRAVAVGDPAILAAVDECARRDGLLLCPEGGATLAAYRQALRDGEVGEDEEVVLFNCATGLKYPLPAAEQRLDRHKTIDFDGL